MILPKVLMPSDIGLVVSLQNLAHSTPSSRVIAALYSSPSHRFPENRQAIFGPQPDLMYIERPTIQWDPQRNLHVKICYMWRHIQTTWEVKCRGDSSFAESFHSLYFISLLNHEPVVYFLNFICIPNFLKILTSSASNDSAICNFVYLAW